MDTDENDQSDAMSQRQHHLVHWFRKGLRLHDNPALREALAQSVSFRCIYILDPWFAGSSQAGINKWRFLLDSLEDLDKNLRKLNSRLYVIRGQPAYVFPKLFKDWKISLLSYEEELEPYGKGRDMAIEALAKGCGVKTLTRPSHTLYDLNKLINKNGGHVPLTYKKFQHIITHMEPPPQPVPPITPEDVGSTWVSICEDEDEQYSVPQLDELGFDIDGLDPPVWPGGETEALNRLDRHMERKAWVASFEKPKMVPQSLLPSQTGLSPYIRFGCLSTRLFYWRLVSLYRKVKKRKDTPVSLHGQLLWREFFYLAATNNPNFDRMVGNPICIQIPWEHNPEALAKWAEGKTGFPWIDAIMTQLHQEGWVHHLARHAVACFLTRGDLWISWVEGMKVFDELLLDGDWSTNAGMWLWLSCSSFFHQFSQTYCPVNFGKQTDPCGDYVRKYLPVLKGFPSQYIYEPWTAPEHVQRTARCIIGKDYPLPMVNHTEASQLNMERMKQIYLHLYRELKGRKNMPVFPKTVGRQDMTGPASSWNSMVDFVRPLSMFTSKRPRSSSESSSSETSHPATSRKFPHRSKLFYDRQAYLN